MVVDGPLSQQELDLQDHAVHLALIRYLNYNGVDSVANHSRKLRRRVALEHCCDWKIDASIIIRSADHASWG